MVFSLWVLNTINHLSKTKPVAINHKLSTIFRHLSIKNLLEIRNWKLGINIVFPQSIQNLINILSKLPGLGARSASRLAIWLFNQSNEDINSLAEAIINLKKQTRACERCFNFTANGDKLCAICADQKRDQSLICVIEDELDIPPIEKTRCFNGVYHILGGAIAPLNGVGPEKLKIKELVERINAQKPAEIILALNPTIEGDTTVLYLERLLKQYNIKISRLGRGLSTGSDLEYTDEATLSNALLNRK